MKLLRMFLMAILGLVVLSAATKPVENLDKRPANAYKVGDYARDFSLPNVNGKTVSLAQFKEAKGFIVIFTCNSCPYAKLYEDRINALDQKYAAKGYPVIAINPNDAGQQPEDSFENMQVRAKEKGFTFPYLHDESQQITAAYGATRTPQVYLLNKDKKGYRVEYIGAVDNNHKDAAQADKKYTEEAVEQLLMGKKPKTNLSKAIGCSIKWKDAN